MSQCDVNGIPVSFMRNLVSAVNLQIQSIPQSRLACPGGNTNILPNAA